MILFSKKGNWDKACSEVLFYEMKSDTSKKKNNIVSRQDSSSDSSSTKGDE